MHRCAFLTMDTLDGYVCDDEQAYGPLAELGWAVAPVSWRTQGIDWRAFDVVVIRSAWDYHRQPGAFLAALEAIARSGVRLENALPLVRWNLEKTYLFRLARRGVPVVPGALGQGEDVAQLETHFETFGTDELVVKPAVGASAEDTFRLARGRCDGVLPAVQAAFRGRAYVVQPFVRSVVEEGEYALFYFDGIFSHAILKTPKAGDFRVQEEHGGTIRAVVPEPALAAAGQRVMDVVQPVPLYARVDLVRDAHGGFALMELELIEPSLYLRMDPAAPLRFARALDARMRP